jgi:hypothetical protein
VLWSSILLRVGCLHHKHEAIQLLTLSKWLGCKPLFRKINHVVTYVLKYNLTYDALSKRIWHETVYGRLSTFLVIWVELPKTDMRLYKIFSSKIVGIRFFMQMQLTATRIDLFNGCEKWKLFKVGISIWRVITYILNDQLIYYDCPNHDLHIVKRFGKYKSFLPYALNNYQF